MQLSVKPSNLPSTQTSCLVLAIFDDQSLSRLAKQIDRKSGGQLSKILKRNDFKAKVGETLVLHDLNATQIERCLILGLGTRDKFDPDACVSALSGLANASRQLTIKKLNVDLDGLKPKGRDESWLASKIAECFSDVFYQYLDMKGNKKNRAVQTLQRIELMGADKQLKALRRGAKLGQALAIGKSAAKDLGNAPSNICTPNYLAKQARSLARRYDRITTTILDEKQMEKLGMGAFLSVSKGSDNPGKMIVMQYKGAASNVKPHVLVGTGITFDSGGISLKGGAGMWEMIYDMCGAATVYGTLQTIAEVGPKMNVVAVMAAAENMPSARASKPGDIVTSMSGQTVEILNTDAEGRLVLCDALTYIERFNPETVVDVATLTGACIVALGSQASAIFANDDAVANALIAAGEQTRDRAWRLPIWESYQPQINSAFADMQNIGGKEAGSITAACFLARFTRKYRWAHMDIAGTSFKWAGVKKGSTGRPVALLTEYLLSQEAGSI